MLLTIKRAAVIGSISAATFVLAPGDVNAQTSFGSAQTNPFGLADSGTYSNASFGDLDNDGDFDLLVGESGGNFKYFENTGTSGSPAFASVSTNPFALTDIGSSSSPSFADLDNDGDLDIITGAGDGNFLYFQNTGTSGVPAFAAATTNSFGLTDIGSYAVSTLVDLDNDGDLDLMAGEFGGDFKYFQNTGTNSAPAFAAMANNSFGLANTGAYTSTISFVDLDNDGDFDLISGGHQGNFYYFQNTGSVNAPAFGTKQTNPFGLVALTGVPNGYQSKPSFVDMDNDGDFDLMVGSFEGNFKYFENTGTSSTPAFATVTTSSFGLPVIGQNSNPSFADLDNDGDLDLLAGEYDGTFNYFEN
ncbi:hypothetical protein B484DRAFT_321396, partial [Ochromonadaceae sp. CCMP2298]